MADPFTLDPEDDEKSAQDISALSGIPLRQALIAQKMRRAQMLMGMAPPAQGAQVGRTYVASSPLEHLANAMLKVQGMRGMKAAEADMAPLAQQQEAAGLVQQRMGLEDRSLKNEKTAAEADAARARAQYYREPRLGNAGKPGSQAFADDKARRASPPSEALIGFMSERGIPAYPGMTTGMAEDLIKSHFASESRPGQVVHTDNGPMLVRPGSNRAKPVVGPDNQPVKPAPTRATQPHMTDQTRQHLTEYADTFDAVSGLSSRFKDEYAGGGALGEASTAISKRLGSWASEKSQESAAFWADWDKLINLPERNRVFGASLSTGERNSWEGARNIKPGANPKLVREKLAELQEIVRRRGTGLSESLISEGYSPDAVNSLGRSRFVAKPTTTGGGERTVVRTGTNRKTGRKVVEYSDGTIEEQ